MPIGALCCAPAMAAMPMRNAVQRRDGARGEAAGQSISQCCVYSGNYRIS